MMHAQPPRQPSERRMHCSPNMSESESVDLKKMLPTLSPSRASSRQLVQLMMMNLAQLIAESITPALGSPHLLPK